MKKLEVLNKLRETYITVKVKVPEVHRNFKFSVCAKSKVKELCIRISELLNLDPIKTNILLYGPYAVVEMNPCTTLLQNKIQDGDFITVKIHYTGNASNISTFYKLISKSTKFGVLPIENYVDEDKYPIYSLKIHSEFCGMKIIGVCVNPICIAYNKEVIFPLGCGTFDLNTVRKKTKCETCPYKDRDLNQPIVVKKITLTNCFWRLDGHFYDASGFYNYKFQKGWIRTEGVDSKVFEKRLHEEEYLDPILYLRPL